ncbi:MAG: hypothetical protein IKA16_01025 [Oscillospiraceae bacterium]|nr:hypothetical protein [Oscillospiraceae bacterium]
MVQKPKIQYVGQFYIHGSEARKLELQEQKTFRNYLPKRLQTIQKVYVDPVAIVGIVVALVMLVTMAMGLLQLQKDWADYDRMASHVSDLKKRNAELHLEYEAMYDLEDVKSKALALGMVPKSELKHATVIVTVPEPEPVPSRVDEMRWFLEGLFA